VALATRAALALADARGFASVAIPGMGTGVGGVAHADAAAIMIKEIGAFVPQALQSVVLVDVDPAMVQAWREVLTETNRLEKGQR
jgi:O-acetyl-ADP-ribose deacetylase (regulator of RNase III)